MLTFNLSKNWFNKIKNGVKTHEYRLAKEFWTKRIIKLHVNSIIKFALGYPKKNDKDKILYAKVLSVKVINGLNTDLKIDKYVFDIEFELKEVE